MPPTPEQKVLQNVEDRLRGEVMNVASGAARPRSG
jgi:hypothetical protein